MKGAEDSVHGSLGSQSSVLEVPSSIRGRLLNPLTLWEMPCAVRSDHYCRRHTCCSKLETFHRNLPAICSTSDIPKAYVAAIW